jgi:transposase
LIDLIWSVAMLDEASRGAILKLHDQGHGSRAIAKALGIARASVQRVLASGQITVPVIERAQLAQAWREEIVELYVRYQGHLGRVHEELLVRGATFSYPALTAFCRRHGIGYTPPRPAGRYEFAPGEEMQHDTSPHRAQIAGVMRRVQTASLVLCASRMIFFQHYPQWRRFECKAFLSAAIGYFGGAAAHCMVDNANVVVASGTGATMIPAPEMAAFAERYGFVFIAHEKGDANRSARVEAPFLRIERGFLAGEDFKDWTDLNERARQTCEAWNARFSRKLHASRRELFAIERVHLKPLPLHRPEVYQLYTRIVDAEGFVHVNRIRYSAPYRLIGKALEVRETLQRVDVYEGPRCVASHARVLGPPDTRVADRAHRPPRGEGRGAQPHKPAPEAIQILQIDARLGGYLQMLKEHIGDRRAPLRRLLAMLNDYPRDAFIGAVELAAQYRLLDLDRLERMVLKRIAKDYFLFDAQSTPGDEPDE